MHFLGYRKNIYMRATYHYGHGRDSKIRIR